MEYKRLTKRDKFGVIALCNACRRRATELCTAEDDDGMCCINEQQNRLAELEDKIEQGTLIELPCKVGDTVWELDLYSKQKIREIKARTLLQIFHWIDNEAFVDYLFLTREEAEKRLKELQG